VSGILSDIKLLKKAARRNTEIFELQSAQFSNRYFIIDNPSARPLLESPEVVGFDTYRAVLEPTADAMGFLFDEGIAPDIDILTILRGGLNYPIEEAASSCGAVVRNMHFLSCERIIEDKQIKGLAIKYEKVFPGKGRTLAIGDILATGDTFRVCLDRFVDIFEAAGGSLKRLIFFTIGGTRAIPLFEDFAERMRSRFPGFEGVDCFFYEGMFTIYTDKGVSGINVPNIDFGWKGGVVSPQFRMHIMRNPDALFEKCIIYDGGARRYEVPVHYDEVMEYWEGIRERADSIDPLALVKEKLGYDGPLGFEEWKEALGFGCLEGLEELWKAESSLLERAPSISIRELSDRRIASVMSILKPYEQ